MEEKTMYYANFNITFGEKDEPMLSHFEDVIYPAFNDGLVRGSKEDSPVYSFNDVKIKEYEPEKYILIGNYIKDTQFKIHTTILNGELTSTPSELPTAPYSRFIVFLNNHRMILVKNEPLSPDLKSFQRTVRSILSEYTHKTNRESNQKNRLPNAIVNIVDMKLPGDIEQALSEISKIRRVQLKFFPLNGDSDSTPISKVMRERMQDLQANTSNIEFNSPKSKQGVADLVEETSALGLSTFTVNGTDRQGQPITIKEDTFTSNQKVTFGRDILEEDDNIFITIAVKNDIITRVGNESQSIFDQFKENIKRLL